MRIKGFPVGKIDPDYLSSLIERYRGVSDPSLVVGPQIGEDAAVIDIGGDDYLIAKTDPITFATDQIGRYVVTVNANDIACMGGMPRWFLATILLPEKRTDKGLVEDIFDQLADACKRLGIAICGGHTEVTSGIDRPIVIGQMLGTVRKERIVRSSGARVGDHIILTKGIAIETTALLAREKEKVLAEEFGRAFIQRCKDFIERPGISVRMDAGTAVEAGEVHAMHDPTEGGLATGLHELARASGVGMEIWRERIPVFNETLALCSFFGLDPLGCIASGALLIVSDPVSSSDILNALGAVGISCEPIGLVKEEDEGVIIVDERGESPLPFFEQDEITRVF